jgi:hypothetical protein
VRRSPALVVGGLVLVVAGALVAATAYTSLSDTRDVVAAVTAIPRGTQIAREQVAVVRVGADPLLDLTAADRIEEIIGSYAVWDIAPGSLVTASGTAAQLTPAAGQAEIGVVVDRAHHPSGSLVPGDSVTLVAVPASVDVTRAPFTRAGVIVEVEDTEVADTVSVTVTVATADAGLLAGLAANRQLAIVVNARER